MKKIRNITLLQILSVVLLSVCLYIIYNNVVNQPVEIWKEIKNKLVKSSFYLVILLVLTLSFINWALESIKWMILTGVKSKKFKSAYRSILAGVATGMPTPNRIGNFVGRILMEKELPKGHVVYLTFISNGMQLIATIFFGGIAVLFFKSSLITLSDFPRILFGVLIILIAGVVYYAIIKAPNWVINNPKLYTWSGLKKEDFKTDISNKTYYRVLLTALIRYFVFTLQYGLLLCYFTSLDILSALLAVYLIYGVITIIPGTILGKLGVREATSLIILQGMGLNEVSIVTAGVILWLFNLGIPSVIGGIILVSKNNRK